MRVALLLMCAVHAAAATGATLIVLEHDGAAVDPAQAEVCRFRAGDRENAFERWLMSQDLTCVPADAAITFPGGQWNVFARSGASAVSAAPLLIDGDAAPANLELTLAPAATLRAPLNPGQRAVAYAPRLGSAFPVDGSGRGIVPAGEELWLFVMERALPVALIPVAAIEAGSERAVDARVGPPAVVGWLSVPQSDRPALNGETNVSPPRIHLTSVGPAKEADPLPRVDRLHGALFRVRDVSAGEAVVDVGGRGWIPDRRDVKITSALTLMPEPLIVRPAATLIVSWSTGGDLPALDRSIGACGDSRRPRQFEVTVSSCPAQKSPRDPVDPDACTAVRQETFGPELTFDMFTMEDVPAGTYRAELRFGNLPPVSTVMSVPPLQQRTLRLFASYNEIYGSLTRGGEPLGEDAVIRFPGGGYGFARAETGEYRAAIRGIIDTDAQIDVKACDGAPEAKVFADVIGRRSTRYDIDIPANRLTINVSDTFTREPLAGATVRYTVMSKRFPRRPLLTKTFSTGEGEDAGRLVLTSVPEREVRLSVSYPAYQKQDVEPFTMLKSDEKTIDVQLVPLRGTHGRIVSDRPFDSGAVLWFSSSGYETERADLASDGTFVYGRSHGPDETMAVVSLSHPLWVIAAPAVGRRQTYEIPFPPAPVRAFDVSLAGVEPSEARYIGVVVGRIRIPYPALQMHQSLRRLPWIVRGNVPMPIRDIAETGSIDVLLGPRFGEVPTRAVGADFFALPQYADPPRQRLAPGATSVVFQME